jgi:hypothetical protein
VHFRLFFRYFHAFQFSPKPIIFFSHTSFYESECFAVGNPCNVAQDVIPLLAHISLSLSLSLSFSLSLYLSPSRSLFLSLSLSLSRSSLKDHTETKQTLASCYRINASPRSHALIPIPKTKTQRQRLHL